MSSSLGDLQFSHSVVLFHFGLFKLLNSVSQPHLHSLMTYLLNLIKVIGLALLILSTSIQTLCSLLHVLQALQASLLVHLEALHSF